MATTSIRVRTDVQETLKSISDTQHQSIGDIVADLVQRYKADEFWKAAEAGYAQLRADPAAWSAWKEETAAWDTTLTDGLDEWDDEEASKDDDTARTTGR